MRAMVITPVVGYLLLLNEEVVPLAEIDDRFRLISSELPWRLMLVYYGSFFTGIAAAVYQIWCPRIVKKYDSAIEYVGAEFNFFWDRDHFSYKLQQVRERLQAVPLWQQQLVGVRHLAEKLTARAKDEKEAGNHLTQAMTGWWHLADNDHLQARRAFCVLGAIGGTLLAIPSVWTFFEVTISAISNVFWK
ncbi:hypothetical protein [Mesorhizobium sp.]|uniref:hypothetical protein n=2 Tax=Mesorhizobium sp. TaxID=1871066 RepID=UPI0025CD44A3|nr:hypothetical protein [Mesorhizobium sp.]